MDFEAITALAVAKHGEEKINSFQRKADGGDGNPPTLTPSELANIPDDRWLSMATNCIFCSGFNWRVVQSKWEGFEAAFEGFDLGRWSFSNDEDLDRLVQDTRIIRNGMKIKTVPENARYFSQRAKEFGNVGKWIGSWPTTDQIGLMSDLQKNGSRLGAMTGQYFLRFMGKDSFILSRDVTAALIRSGIIEKQPTSKKALTSVQNAFNQWMEETGLGLTAISRTLAHSIDA